MELLVIVCYPLCLTVTMLLYYKELVNTLCYYLYLFVTPCYSLLQNIAVISADNFNVFINTKIKKPFFSHADPYLKPF
jgi:hypothetical protein